MILPQNFDGCLRGGCKDKTSAILTFFQQKEVALVMLRFQRIFVRVEPQTSNK